MNTRKSPLRQFGVNNQSSRRTLSGFNPEHILRLVPERLPEFTEVYYQLTNAERMQVAAALLRHRYDFHEAMTILAYANSMVISEHNAKITVRDLNGLKKIEDGSVECSYVIENFPMSVAEKLTHYVNSRPEELKRYCDRAHMDAMQRVTVKK